MTSAEHSFLIGLIGSGLANSRSSAIHEAEAAAHGLRLIYRTVDFAPEAAASQDLDPIVQHLEAFGFDGFNVTHPFKQGIIPVSMSYPLPPGH